MEENEITMEENEITKTNFVLSDESEAFLKETAKWGYFLSILGFVFIGIIVLMAFFIGAFLLKIQIQLNSKLKSSTDSKSIFKNKSLLV